MTVLRPAMQAATRRHRAADLELEPLTVLYEANQLPAYDLPEQLQVTYGGPLGFAEPRLVANFVATIDGVVAIPDLPQSSTAISAESTADRFVLALLRACADVVLLGSGTLHAHPSELWTGPHAYPPAAAGFASLRRRLRRSAAPLLAVVTASGDLDVHHPALRANALVLTTDRGAEKLAGRLSKATRMLALGEAAVDLRAAVATLHEHGHHLIVSEAGPHLLGSLLDEDLVDELFLTQSPLLAGRGASPRLSLVEGHALLPDRNDHACLLSVRRAGSHLLLRYAVRPGDHQRPLGT